MTFGYIPNKSISKDLILRAIGYPNLIRRIQAEALMRMLNPKLNETILDVGCGPGYFTYEISKYCNKSLGIDWNLNSKHSFAMKTQPKLVYIKGDIQKLPFASDMFDKILLSSVLQMVQDDELLLEECYRILKPDGELILSVPLGYIYIKKLNDYKYKLKEVFGSLGKTYYNYKQIVELVKMKGFEVNEIEYSPKWWGSLIFEIGLFAWYRFRFPFFSVYSFILLYPIMFLDKFSDQRQGGNELIIKVRKVKNNE